MSDDAGSNRFSGVVIGLFAVISLLIIVDLAVDYREGASRLHLFIELLVLSAALFGMGLLWRQLGKAKAGLAQAEAAALIWRKEHAELLQGLAAAIADEFSRWELTPAESEVGLLLLKGLGHKEIAELRQTSERTVREQSRAIYRKAGLPGRAALAAFFLEDLLLPQAFRAGK